MAVSSVVVDIGGEGRAGLNGAGRVRVVDAAGSNGGGEHGRVPAIEECAVETEAYEMEGDGQSLPWERETENMGGCGERKCLEMKHKNRKG